MYVESLKRNDPSVLYYRKHIPSLTLTSNFRYRIHIKPTVQTRPTPQTNTTYTPRHGLIGKSICELPHSLYCIRGFSFLQLGPRKHSALYSRIGHVSGPYCTYSLDRLQGTIALSDRRNGHGGTCSIQKARNGYALRAVALGIGEPICAQSTNRGFVPVSLSFEKFSVCMWKL